MLPQHIGGDEAADCHQVAANKTCVARITMHMITGGWQLETNKPGCWSATYTAIQAHTLHILGVSMSKGQYHMRAKHMKAFQA